MSSTNNNKTSKSHLLSIGKTISVNNCMSLLKDCLCFKLSKISLSPTIWTTPTQFSPASPISKTMSRRMSCLKNSIFPTTRTNRSFNWLWRVEPDPLQASKKRKKRMSRNRRSPNHLLKSYRLLPKFNLSQKTCKKRLNSSCLSQCS